MKPDWKDAPEWAQWLAMDLGGPWVWFEFQPEYEGPHGEWSISGQPVGAKWEVAGPPRLDPACTLEHRPLVSLMAATDTWATTTNHDARPGSEGQGA